ncbi:MAG TPA: glycosyltransferase family 4 protein [Aeromicrobium sp.]|nr:glycosyltransferase family 4 protein [Aeromicrobium sp.]
MRITTMKPVTAANRGGREMHSPSTTSLISFVWSPGETLPAGTGGSENYTVGQVRELNRRGVDAQVVTVGLGSADGRDGFPGIPFLALARAADVGRLDGTVVFVSEFPHVATVNPPFQMLHVPPPSLRGPREEMRSQTRDRTPIATSRFAAALWARFLDVDIETIAVVYPFAETAFGTHPRAGRRTARVRVLYAGRLSPEKGIYTLLSTLHHELITELADDGIDLTFTVTTAGAEKPQGRIIHRMLATHSGISLVTAALSPTAMAALMTDHDIVVMPSNSQYWHETFGIVSIEAQHAGCRVVASDDGGLPETDCGAITFIRPDDAAALAEGIRQAIELGPVPPGQRDRATARFTIEQSVDQLLVVLDRPHQPTPAEIIEELETLGRLPSLMPPPSIRPRSTA